eukprot:SAG31_NODE_8655_length_1412_cov_1.772277_1_plen_371_part_01
MDGSNQWQCDDTGTKVDALKGLAFGSFPPLLTLQLKRFIFDWATNRRLKLNDPVEIEPVLNMALVSNGGSDSNENCDAETGNLNYELFAMLIHSGTALGGHYYAYVKDLSQRKWYNFNDSQVNPCTDTDLLVMLNSTSEAVENEQPDHGRLGKRSPTVLTANDTVAVITSPSQTAHSGGGPTDSDTGSSGTPSLSDAQLDSKSTQSQRLADGMTESNVADGALWTRRVSSANAYMLVYRQVDRAAPTVEDDEVPSAVQAEVAAENAAHARLSGLYAFQQRLRTLMIHTTDGRTAKIEVLQESTIATTTMHACDIILASGPPRGAVTDRYAAAVPAVVDLDGGRGHSKLSRLRLRKFWPHSGKAGETYTGKE